MQLDSDGNGAWLKKERGMHFFFFFAMASAAQLKREAKQRALIASVDVM
jgi:hypothetical protein